MEIIEIYDELERAEISEKILRSRLIGLALKNQHLPISRVVNQSQCMS